jgi:aminocarboxymuconate-semialdehyde decarboxylase
MATCAKMTATKNTLRSPVVDIHTHLYPPFYIDLLKARNEIPYVRAFPPDNQLRLINRAAENGRPMVPHFYDIKTKIAFMDHHKIDISVLSLGNPWLDFLQPDTAGQIAQDINDSTNAMCAEYPGRLYFFAALPLSATLSVVLAEISRLKRIPYARGIVLGTSGLGHGLDDPDLLPVFKALAEESLPIFLHPHYGLPATAYGPRGKEYGQVMPLALGFPMETTIALARLILFGCFSAVPTLQIIASHSGGTLPFLAGRIEACIQHDRLLESEGKINDPQRKTVWDVLKNNIYLDGVIYDKIGLQTATDSSGVDRVMFGTDHPFFPPLDGSVEWPSMTVNLNAAKQLYKSREEYNLVMGGNAARVLNLT